MAESLRVVVSHPAKQGNVYHRPWAAERAGIDVVFLTGLYYKPDHAPYSIVRYLPDAMKARAMRLLDKRRLDGLSPENVVSLFGPILELAIRPFGLNYFALWWDLHDRLAGRWIRGHRSNGSRTILHGFQGACLRIFQAAEADAGVIRLFEATFPPLMDVAKLAAWQMAPTLQPSAQLFQRELDAAHFVLVQSAYGIDTAMTCGVPREKIFPIHQGVDIHHYRPRGGPRRSGPLRVLFVGSVGRRKGVHLLLEAWKEIQVDAELLLVGNANSPDAAELLDQKPANCRSLGFVSDEEHLELLQHADLLVHPSLAEGGCNAVYEALACGLPCVISRNASSAVRHGIDGLVVAPGDVSALSAAIRRLCLDAELRSQMATAARQRAETLSWDHYAERLAAIYRGLAEFARDGEANVLEPLWNTSF